MKNCPKCKRLLSEDHFHRDGKRSDGMQLWCKECGLADKKYRYWHGRKDAVQRSARSTSLKKYGLSLQAYDDMFKRQNGVCLICGEPETQRSNPRGKVDSLRVDHCHKTRKVRGLLCSRCNFGIAQFHDDPVRLMRAAGYLEGWI